MIASSLRPAAGRHGRAPGFDDHHVLVAALKRGDGQALAAFFRQFEPLVQGTVRRVLGYDDEVGDVTQETFLRAAESLDSLRDPRALVSWTTQIAVYTAMDCLRRRVRRRWLLFVGAAPSEEPAPSCDEAAREAVRATYRVLDRMPAGERAAFALRFIDGLEIDALADTLGCSRSTAKRRVVRATARFRALARHEAALVPWVGELP